MDSGQKLWKVLEGRGAQEHCHGYRCTCTAHCTQPVLPLASSAGVSMLGAPEMNPPILNMSAPVPSLSASVPVLRPAVIPGIVTQRRNAPAPRTPAPVILPSTHGPLYDHTKIKYSPVLAPVREHFVSDFVRIPVPNVSTPVSNFSTPVPNCNILVPNMKSTPLLSCNIQALNIHGISVQTCSNLAPNPMKSTPVLNPALKRPETRMNSMCVPKIGVPAPVPVHCYPRVHRPMPLPMVEIPRPIPVQMPAPSVILPSAYIPAILPGTHAPNLSQLASVTDLGLPAPIVEFQQLIRVPRMGDTNCILMNNPRR